MKKILTLLMVTVLVLGLVGCSSNTENNDLSQDTGTLMVNVVDTNGNSVEGATIKINGKEKSAKTELAEGVYDVTVSKNAQSVTQRNISVTNGETNTVTIKLKALATLEIVKPSDAVDLTVKVGGNAKGDSDLGWTTEDNKDMVKVDPDSDIDVAVSGYRYADDSVTVSADDLTAGETYQVPLDYVKKGEGTVEINVNSWQEEIAALEGAKVNVKLSDDSLKEVATISGDTTKVKLPVGSQKLVVTKKNADDEEIYNYELGPKVEKATTVVSDIYLDSSVTMIVKDNETDEGNPIQGATVKVNGTVVDKNDDGNADVTDSNGELSVVVPYGTNEVTIDGDGDGSTYSPVTKEINVENKDTQEKEVTAKLQKSTLSVTVNAGDTDVTGNSTVTVDGQAPSDYDVESEVEVEVENPNYPTVTKTVTMENKTTTNPTVYLASDVTVNVNETGSNADKVVIGSKEATVSSGSATINNVPVGEQTVVVKDGSDNNLASKTIDVEQAASKTVDVYLGNLVDLTINGGTAPYTIDVEGKSDSITSSDNTELFKAEAGYVDVTVTDDNGISATKTLEVKEEATITPSITLEVPAKLTVKSGSDVVADAEVTVNGNYVGKTDANGEIQFDASIGDNKVVARDGNYNEVEKTISVDAQKDPVQEFTTYVASKVTMEVNAGADPLQGVDVTIADASGQTDANGQVTLTAPVGDVNLEVISEYGNISDTISIPNQETMVGDTGYLASDVTLTVLDPDGNVVEDAEVKLNGTPLEGTTDANGEITFKASTLQENEVSVSKDGLGITSKSFEVDGETGAVEVKYPKLTNSYKFELDTSGVDTGGKTIGGVYLRGEMTGSSWPANKEYALSKKSDNTWTGMFEDVKEDQSYKYYIVAEDGSVISDYYSVSGANLVVSETTTPVLAWKFELDTSGVDTGEKTIGGVYLRGEMTGSSWPANKEYALSKKSDNTWTGMFEDVKEDQSYKYYIVAEDGSVISGYYSVSGANLVVSESATQ